MTTADLAGIDNDPTLADLISQVRVARSRSRIAERAVRDASNARHEAVDLLTTAELNLQAHLEKLVGEPRTLTEEQARAQRPS